jgi:hypothetical protein
MMQQWILVSTFFGMMLIATLPHVHGALAYMMGLGMQNLHSVAKHVWECM